MTTEQILEKQVEALEKLLQLRAAITEELEAKISRLENEVARNNLAPYPGHIINTPWVGPPVMYPGIGGGSTPWNPNQSGTVIISNICTDGAPHEYPSTWNGITFAPCKKCGMGTITSVTTTGLAQTVDTANQNNIFTLTNVAK